LFGKGPAGPQAFWKFPQLSPPLPFTVNSRGAIHLIVASEKIPDSVSFCDYSVMSSEVETSLVFLGREWLEIPRLRSG